MGARWGRTGGSQAGDPAARGGLNRRVGAASAVLALVVGAAFATLFFAVRDVRGAERRADHAQQVLIAANTLERLVLDLETGARGFALTRQERFLAPWTAARRSFPAAVGNLRRLVARNPGERTHAERIARAEQSYITDYSVPLVAAARRGDPSADSVAATAAGKRRVDAMRAEFDRLIGAERRAAAQADSRVTDVFRRTIAAVVLGLAGSLALIALYAGYVTQAIVRPVRRAAAMAGRLAGGDLAARMPETGIGEVGGLQRAFNTMGESLERNRDELAALAAEQAALRRVATLVAHGASPASLLARVAQEVGTVLPDADLALVGRYDYEGRIEFVGGWTKAGEASFVGNRVALGGDNVATLVFERNAAARVDRLGADEAPATALASRFATSSAGAPISVEGRLWGVITVASTSQRALPPGIENRLAQFTELVATAIANSQAREEVGALAADQAALRRVATLVARAAPSEAVFAAVAAEVGQRLAADHTLIGRYEPGDAMTLVAGWPSDAAPFGIAPRTPVAGHNLTTLVHETGRPARIDSYAQASGPFADDARARGVRSGVGVPIAVGGRLWGLIIVGSTTDRPFPPDAETRLTDFTELAATAIANAHARDEMRRAAEQQAALRRVATLVAEGAAPPSVFAAVPREIAGLVPGGDVASVFRYEPDGGATILGIRADGDHAVAVGTRVPPGESSIATRVRDTGQAARIDEYGPGSAAVASVHSSVAAPITVEGRLWGGVVVASTGELPLPPDTEARIAGFAFLAATAIANAQAREELHRVAAEQAALRRVATLVAEAAPPAEVFAAVADEIDGLLPGDSVGVFRYDADGGATYVAVQAQEADSIPVGTWIPPDDRSIAMFLRQAGHPIRMDDFGRHSNSAEAAVGVRCAVAAPIAVEGRLWGGVGVGSMGSEPLPAGAEHRLAEFAELLATAIANTEARSELSASRARIVASADETRRRIERDLHDGAQQRLVSLALQLRATRDALPPDLGETVEELDRLAGDLNETLDELREYARGVHPAILAEGGLPPALRTLARRAPLPVELTVRIDGRLPEPVEIGAYYVVSEALANAAKHANASHVVVETEVADDVLRVSVRDDGIGGANLARGSGLVGLKDRIEALGGRLRMRSERGAGTTLEVELPLAPAGEPIGPR